MAEKTIQEFKDGDQGKYEKVKEAANRYREFADATLRYLVDSGRMAKRVVDSEGELVGGYEFIKNHNIQYVALNRVIETEPDVEYDGYAQKSGSIGSSSKVFYKIKGSSRKIENPYVSLLESTYRIIKESDRNRIMLAFRDMVNAPRMMYDDSPELSKLSDVAVLGKEGDKNSVKIFVDGKPEHWILQKDVYDAVKNLSGDVYNLPGLVKMPAQILRFCVTNYPTFAVCNIVRDTQDRLIKSTEGSGLKNLFGKKEDWHELALSGGLNAGFYYKDKTHYYGLLESTMDELSKNKKFILIDPIVTGKQIGRAHV